ncbi:MAG: hypothetical protein SP1CHLAM54_11540 [Chlamydiia bacterium]|nr:hypothetical protein [Chlamydiia bacterium]MCH9616057.1 hypothetical protein [Chlamydiia bacterium]MCH9629080.1 hypothetical protein [Chlamydiia bacterium]
MVKLGHIIYYVKDVEETVAFFEKAFGLKRQFIDPTGVYAQMQTGETALGFAAIELAKKNLRAGFQPVTPEGLPFGSEISFRSDDLAVSLQTALEAGCTLVESIEEKFWGETVCYVRTPQGILVELAATELVNSETN